MSLWTCPKHGLYGGEVFCPQCGETGDFATLEQPAGAASMTTQEAIERLRAFLREGDERGTAEVDVEDLRTLLTLVDAPVGDELVERVARAMAEASGARSWEALCPVGFVASPRFIGKDYWLSQARAAIEALSGTNGDGR